MKAASRTAATRQGREKKCFTEMVADEVILLGGRGEGGGGAEDFGRSRCRCPGARRAPQPARQQPQAAGFDPGITDDDVPF